MLINILIFVIIELMGGLVMRLNELFIKVCEEFNLEPIEIEENGKYLLSINDSYHFNIEKIDDQDLLLIYSYVFPDLGDYTHDVAKKLMEFNAFGLITGSAQFSFSAEASKFLLSETFDLDSVSPTIVAHRMNEFLKILDICREEWEKWQFELLASENKNTEDSVKESGHVLYKL